ncbi:hypothetical protein ACSIGC_07065 [Tenacibaculum sp. ZS6-P6]|uniref:hypothetical protein n=1 Tax=Tenacibaculum sp. ZS6-P6 TaxID=3447503 RepID=UPI003F956626
MTLHKNHTLNSTDKLTLLAKEFNIHSWNELTSFIANLPYGRNENRHDFSLVLSEKKGSCSSKHALLKALADVNQIPNVSLILGIYKMNHKNTPGIGNVLAENNLDFVPEAHCYLSIQEKRFDFTSSSSSITRIENDILSEIEITPNQVAEYKVQFHKEYMKNWVKKNNIPFDFETVWKIREQCIYNLSQ